ncbi:MAG TPA: DNA-3-methyladenine glycosylase 2 family protein, partial [Actinoplanes sp.]|nr:DNA-3-methyladenine glycosylase 2 family protein [Actinoplanes sp.]
MSVTTVTRTLTPPEHYHLAGSVGSLIATRHDPCARLEGGGFRLAARTPAGPGSLHLTRTGGDLLATGYGPGAGWLADHAD